MVYYVVNKTSGDVLDKFNSVKEAESFIKDCEWQDEINNVYSPDCYGIAQKIKFHNICEPYIAIHFSTQNQLEKLIDYLKIYEYTYGTNDGNLNDIKELGIRYFPHDEFIDNRYLSLDRSRRHCRGNYVSCGLGCDDTKYDFKDIDWNID